MTDTTKYRFTWSPDKQYKFDTPILRETFLFIMRNKIEFPAFTLTSDELGKTFSVGKMADFIALSQNLKIYNGDWSSPYNAANDTWTFPFPLTDKNVNTVFTWVASHENLFSAFWDIFLFNQNDKSPCFQPWVKDERTVKYDKSDVIESEHLMDFDLTICESVALYYNEDWDDLYEDIDDGEDD